MDIFSLPIVEVGLSIIISWALFAIFCSMIHETLVQIKSERGRFFKKYILQQLYDNPNKINWGSMLYTNSAVDLLSREHNKPASEITPKIFSEALIEVVANAHLVQSSKNGDPNYQPTFNNPLLSDFEYGTKILLPSSVIDFLKSALTKARIKATTDGLLNEDLVYKQLIEDISDWYAQLCTRTSIWYGKATKMRLFFLGLIISVALNINSVTLFKYYNDNPTARKAVIAYYQKNKVALEQLANKYDHKIKMSVIDMPTDTSSAARIKTEQLQQQLAKDSTKLDSVKADIKAFQFSIDSLTKANKIPIGWNYEKKKQYFPKTCSDTLKLNEILLKNKKVKYRGDSLTSLVIRKYRDSILLILLEKEKSKPEKTKSTVLLRFNDTVKRTGKQRFELTACDSVRLSDSTLVKDCKYYCYLEKKADSINESLIAAEKKAQKDKEARQTIQTTTMERVWDFVLLCLGFIASAFAASVGAPFWFDLLKKANPIKSKTT
ncbi:hypothetical protein [Flavobacterium sp.]|uniref:hypothetical protein n=1 Tax=Flavobacterium sp. TaxID=239 RepID=UPI0039E40120